MVKTSKIIATLGVAAGLGVALLPLATYAETDSETVNVEVSSWLTLAVTNNSETPDAGSATVAMQKGATDTSLQHIIEVSGNYNKGYELTMAADHATLNGPSSRTIPSISGTSLPEPGTGASGHGWGYRVKAHGESDFPSAWNAIPTTATPIGGTTEAARTDVFDETTTVNFGIVTAEDEVAGTYTAEITYVASGKTQ